MVYLGIDLHRRFCYVVAVDVSGSIIQEKRILHSQGDWDRFLTSLKEPIMAVVESTFNWYFLANWLQTKVVKLVLANPFKVRAIAEAQIKNDRIDATTLAQLLRVNMIPECYVSTPDERMYKNLIRHRVSLVRMRTQLKNKVHTLLARNGINQDILYSDLFGKQGRQWLADLALPQHEQWILTQQLTAIDNINISIKEADNQLKDVFKNYPQAKLLETIPGIGTFLALLIASEIGDINRFQDQKKLHCYAGLVPSLYASGNKVRMGQLINQSNKWLRWGLIESANIAHLHNLKFKKIFNRVKTRKGVNTAKVALARYMLTVIYHILKNEEPFIDQG